MRSEYLKQGAKLLVTTLVYLVIIALVDAAMNAHMAGPQGYKINFEYKVF